MSYVAKATYSGELRAVCRNWPPSIKAKKTFYGAEKRIKDLAHANDSLGVRCYCDGCSQRLATFFCANVLNIETMQTCGHRWLFRFRTSLFPDPHHVRTLFRWNAVWGHDPFLELLYMVLVDVNVCTNSFVSIASTQWTVSTRPSFEKASGARFQVETGFRICEYGWQGRKKKNNNGKVEEE